MYISFGRKLKGLGNVRVGHRLKGSSAWYFLFIYYSLQLCWYMLLGTLWLVYGFGYLFFYLPIKGVIKLVQNINQKRKIEEAAKRYERPNT